MFCDDGDTGSGLSIVTTAGHTHSQKLRPHYVLSIGSGRLQSTSDPPRVETDVQEKVYVDLTAKSLDLLYVASRCCVWFEFYVQYIVSTQEHGFEILLGLWHV